MNVICPRSYNTTAQEYQNSISTVVGEVTVLNKMVQIKLSASSLKNIQPILKKTIEKIEKIQSAINFDLLELKKSTLFCCYVNNQRCLSTAISVLNTGMIVSGGIIAYNSQELASKTLGVVCIVIGQLFSKAKNHLVYQTKQALKRELGLKERLCNCELLKEIASEAYELSLILENASNETLQTEELVSLPIYNSPSQHPDTSRADRPSKQHPPQEASDDTPQHSKISENRSTKLLQEKITQIAHLVDQVHTLEKKTLSRKTSSLQGDELDGLNEPHEADELDGIGELDSTSQHPKASRNRTVYLLQAKIAKMQEMTDKNFSLTKLSS